MEEKRGGGAAAAGFRNEIIWYYKNASRGKQLFAKSHDVIFWYSKSTDCWTFNRADILVPYESGMTSWRYEQKGKEAPKGKTPDDVLTIPSLNSMAKERTGYPTQKPLALLDRILNASLSKDGIVLDPFCGCATTCVAADRLQRDWIGIDISPKAAELVVERIKADQGLFQEILHREDVPKRTDLGDIPRYNAPENKEHLYGKQGGHCNGCQDHFQSRLLEVDHIIATSVGGTNHIDNLQLLCSHCNRMKGNRGQEYLLSRLNS